MMNICMFSRMYPCSLDEPMVSGETKNPFYLSRALARAGHTVTVITDGARQDHQTWEDVEIHRVGSGFLKGVVRLLDVDLRQTHKFHAIQKATGFSVVHSHISALTLALLKKWEKLRLPLVTTAHGTGLSEFATTQVGRTSLHRIAKNLNARSLGAIDRVAWLNSDRVISAGAYQVKEMLHRYGIPADRVVPICNGVDTSFYKPDNDSGAQVRQKYSLTDKVVVLFVGRLARKKGVQFLIEASPAILQRIPNAIFVVAGGIERLALYESYLRKMLLQFGLAPKYLILEGTPEFAMPALYNSADVCVVPSIEYEPLPTVVFEAMACGKPVVASDLGGIPDQLGYRETLVPPGDATCLSDKIISVLESSGLSVSFSKRNRERAVSEFDWKAVAGAHIRLYEELCDSYTAPGRVFAHAGQAPGNASTIC